MSRKLAVFILVLGLVSVVGFSAAVSQATPLPALPALPHDLTFVGASLELPTQTSHLSSSAAAQAARNFLNRNTDMSSATVKTTFGLFKDRYVYPKGRHAWVVSIDGVTASPSGGPAGSDFSSVRTPVQIDVVVDDASGKVLFKYVHGTF